MWGLNDVAESVLYFMVKRFECYHATNEELLTNLWRELHPIPNDSSTHIIELTVNTVNLEAEEPAKTSTVKWEMIYTYIDMWGRWKMTNAPDRDVAGWGKDLKSRLL